VVETREEVAMRKAAFRKERMAREDQNGMEGGVAGNRKLIRDDEKGEGCTVSTTMRPATYKGDSALSTARSQLQYGQEENADCL